MKPVRIWFSLFAREGTKSAPVSKFASRRTAPPTPHPSYGSANAYARTERRGRGDAPEKVGRCRLTSAEQAARFGSAECDVTLRYGVKIRSPWPRAKRARARAARRPVGGSAGKVDSSKMAARRLATRHETRSGVHGGDSCSLASCARAPWARTHVARVETRRDATASRRRRDAAEEASRRHAARRCAMATSIQAAACAPRFVHGDARALPCHLHNAAAADARATRFFARRASVATPRC